VTDDREAAPEDATRRTRLASERTYLAWWRSGLTAFAVALAAGALLPELSDEAELPYRLAGAGFGVVGVAAIAYGWVRHRNVERALDRGEFAHMREGVAFALAAATAALGLLTVVLILAAAD
jgi:putative membrane protein